MDAGLSAPDIAAGFEVSVSAVCRALTGLSALSQTKPRQAAEHYATLLTLAQGSGGADGATVERLRGVFGPARAVQSATDPGPSCHRG